MFCLYLTVLSARSNVVITSYGLVYAIMLINLVQSIKKLEGVIYKQINKVKW